MLLLISQLLPTRPASHFQSLSSSAELYFFKECCQSGNLLQPQYFILIHTQMPGDPGIRTPQLMQLADDVAHESTSCEPLAGYA